MNQRGRAIAMDEEYPLGLARQRQPKVVAAT
jgi:hypothetical protein